MNELNVIKLFGHAIAGNSVDQTAIQKEAIKRGFIVHPYCYTDAVLNWLKLQPVDYNATFYKEWKTVKEKNRFDIWVDQIVNYCFNYIGGYSMQPNDGSEQPEWHNLKRIDPISPEDAKKRACDLVYSGVALKQETLDMVFSIANIGEVSVDLIKNKEALMIVCEHQNTLPKDPVEMVRFLVYQATGETLLIKSRELINKIESLNNRRTDLIFNEQLEKFGLDKISEIFNRFKPIFLAFKTPQTAKTVNRIRKLAKVNHKPMQTPVINRVFSSTEREIADDVKNWNPLQKIKLIQAINVRRKKNNHRFFTIRNGKIWVKEENVKVDKQYAKNVKDIIYRSLVKDVKVKEHATFYIPKGIKYTAPTSEKMFVGNFPIGTSFDFSGKNAIIGIHRDKEHANGFFDFSLNSPDGNKIGWNSHFKNSDNSILFSGDICHNDNSQPAVELFYAENGFDGNYMVKANNYDSFRFGDIQYNLFLAIEPINGKVKKNYMVDPNNILFSIPLVCPKDKREVSPGVLACNKFILAEFITGNKRVSGKSITDLYADFAIKTLKCYVNLGKLLKDAGYKKVDSPHKATIDLSVDKISKDSILGLF